MRKRVELTLASILILLCIGLRLAHTDNIRRQDRAAHLIALDGLASMGELERPVVQFPHGMHAVGDDDASCRTCHDVAPDGEGLLFVFKAQEGLSREEIKALYHDQCIGCHADRESANKPTGPQMCSGCHEKEPLKSVKPMHPVDFNTPLHTLHTEKAALACQTCHDLPDSPAPFDQDRSHDLCLGCHLTGQSNDSASAPLDCGGCHTSKSPLLVLDGDASQGGQVAFDHELHEMADVSCEVCHHKEPETACRECHTDGKTDTDVKISIQAAMHTKKSERSCVGCHEEMGIGDVDDCTSCHQPFGEDAS